MPKGLWAAILAASLGAAPGPQDPPEDAAKGLLEELRTYRHKIVFESNADGGWDLFLVGTDGSDPVNLTRTPDVDELYPKASPDGTRICFVADEGKGDAKVRNLYVMKVDGTGRVKIADNAREPCWSADGKSIAYLKGEFDAFTCVDFATRGIFIYDLETGRTREHPNRKIQHLYTLNWSPDGKWFVATVHGGMGFKHGIIALEAAGEGAFNLDLKGCRPDLSPDGKRIAWGHRDYAIGVADLDLTGAEPRLGGHRDVIESEHPIESYHADWSPDGRYIAFSRGPKHRGKDLKGLLPEFPGVEAPGWNICVADPKRKNRWIGLMFDGKSCKEPDWVLVPEERGK